MPYHAQWSPPVDEVLHKNFFPNKKDGILVECGAHNGLCESTGLFFNELGWTCYNIEADKDIYESLYKNRPVTNRNCNLNYALSDKDYEVITFDKGPIPGNFGKATSITFKTLFENQKEKIDLLVLDIEGQELTAIKGIFGSEVLPEIICVEYTWDSVGLPALDFQLGMLGYTRLFLSWNNAFFSRESKHIKDHYFGETKNYFELIK